MAQQNVVPIGGGAAHYTLHYTSTTSIRKQRTNEPPFFNAEWRTTNQPSHLTIPYTLLVHRLFVLIPLAMCVIITVLLENVFVLLVVVSANNYMPYLYTRSFSLMVMATVISIERLRLSWIFLYYYSVRHYTHYTTQHARDTAKHFLVRHTHNILSSIFSLLQKSFYPGFRPSSSGFYASSILSSSFFYQALNILPICQTKSIDRSCAPYARIYRIYVAITRQIFFFEKFLVNSLNGIFIIVHYYIRLMSEFVCVCGSLFTGCTIRYACSCTWYVYGCCRLENVFVVGA